MRELLFVDCLIRGDESRTAKMADAFLAGLDPEAFHVTRLRLMEEGLQPLSGDFFQQRQRLLEAGELNHPRFRYAHQLAAADDVLVAAPFWDLAFPALLKVYIENVSVDGITFGCNEQGMYGLCKGRRLVFLTSRGGFYENHPDEQGSRYLEVLSRFFGFEEYRCVAADGLDSEGADAAAILKEACEAAGGLAREMSAAG